MNTSIIALLQLVIALLGSPNLTATQRQLVESIATQAITITQESLVTPVQPLSINPPITYNIPTYPSVYPESETPPSVPVNNNAIGAVAEPSCTLSVVSQSFPDETAGVATLTWTSENAVLPITVYSSFSNYQAGVLIYQNAGSLNSASGTQKGFDSFVGGDPTWFKLVFADGTTCDATSTVQ